MSSPRCRLSNQKLSRTVVQILFRKLLVYSSPDQAGRPLWVPFEQMRVPKFQTSLFVAQRHYSQKWHRYPGPLLPPLSRHIINEEFRAGFLGSVVQYDPRETWSPRSRRPAGVQRIRIFHSNPPPPPRLVSISQTQHFRSDLFGHDSRTWMLLSIWIRIQDVRERFHTTGPPLPTHTASFIPSLFEDLSFSPQRQSPVILWGGGLFVEILSTLLGRGHMLQQAVLGFECIV